MDLLDDHPSIEHRVPADMVLRAHLDENEQLQWAAYQQHTTRWWHRSVNEFLQILGAVLWIIFMVSPHIDDQNFYLLPRAAVLVLLVSLAIIVYRGYVRFRTQKSIVYGLTAEHLIRLHPEQSSPIRWALLELPPLLAFARTDGTFDAYYTEKVVTNGESNLVQRMLIENAEGNRQVVQLILSVQRNVSNDMNSK